MDNLAGLQELLASGQVADGIRPLLESTVAELIEARRALTKTMELVGDPDFWENADSTLEHIGDAVNSERYPVWELYGEG